MKVYMCATAYDHEADCTDVKVFPSVKALLSAHPGCAECGVYEVDLTFVKVAAKPKKMQKHTLLT